MQRKVPFLEGEYYHLYNRGVEKRHIFSSANDYKRFMALLYLANSDENLRLDNIFRNTAHKNIFTTQRGNPLVALGAFCLMPNHFHLLATPLMEKGLSKYMLKLQTGYSMYFNVKNRRDGSLFQGPFKSEHAGEDRYLKYLFSYIHLNPAKLKEPHWKEKVRPKDTSLKLFVQQYPYSSYNAYLTGVHSITNPVPFPQYFSSKKEVEAHVGEWLESR